jgi:hypothetical protein
MGRAAFWRWTFAAAIAGVLVMALLPAPPRLPANPSDKLQHLIAFAVLTLLALPAFRGKPLPPLGLGLVALGGLIELLQTIPALRRHGDLVDWLVDSAAVAAVLMVVVIARRLRQASATPSRRSL